MLSVLGFVCKSRMHSAKCDQLRYCSEPVNKRVVLEPANDLCLMLLLDVAQPNGLGGER